MIAHLGKRNVLQLHKQYESHNSIHELICIMLLTPYIIFFWVKRRVFTPLFRESKHCK